MTVELSATAVAEHVLCRRRARLRGSVTPHLETSAFAAIVRRALQRAAESRIAKEPYDLAYVVHDLARERGLETDAALVERARNVTRFGLQALYEFKPVATNVPFGMRIADVRVTGTIDLVAERADESMLAFAFRTGEVPVSTFELALGFARDDVTKRYPKASYAVCDLYEDRAVLRETTLPDGESLASYVGDASESPGDAPRPGIYCPACDFLARCPEGRAVSDLNVSDSAVLVSSVPIARDTYEGYLLACGAERLDDEDFVLMTERGSIWISHTPNYTSYVTGVTEGFLDAKLGAEPAFCCNVSITPDPESDRLAMEFAIAFLERWPGVLYDYAASTLGVEELRERLARGAYVWKPDAR